MHQKELELFLLSNQKHRMTLSRMHRRGQSGLCSTSWFVLTSSIYLALAYLQKSRLQSPLTIAEARELLTCAGKVLAFYCDFQDYRRLLSPRLFICMMNLIAQRTMISGNWGENRTWVMMFYGDTCSAYSMRVPVAMIGMMHFMCPTAP